MKKFLAVVICAISLVTLCSCFQTTSESKIPDRDIRYTYYTFGNVIYEEKQAIFLNFVSNYDVCKIEYSGKLVDVRGNTLYVFNEGNSINNPEKNVEVAFRVDAEIIKKVATVYVTKITAYTREKIVE